MKKGIKLPLLVSLTAVTPLVTLSTSLTSCKSNEKKAEFGVSVTKWNSENYVIGNSDETVIDASLAPRRGAPFITNIWGLHDDPDGQGHEDIVNVTICSDKSQKLTLTNEVYDSEDDEVDFSVDEETLKTNTILPRIKFKGSVEDPDQEARLLRTKGKYGFALKYKIKRWNPEIEEHEEIASFVIKNLTLDVAVGTTPNQFKFKVDETDNSATITGFAEETDLTNCDFLVIPAEVADSQGQVHQVIAIDDFAFYDGVERKTLIPNNFHYLMLDGYWGKEDTTPLLETIGEYNFKSCPCSGYLYMPASVKTIGRRSFEQTHFTEIDFQNEGSNTTSIETIGDYAFSQCTDLKFDLEIPNTVRKIGEKAFYNDPLTNLSFEDVDEVSADNNINIDAQAFAFNKKEGGITKIATDLTLPKRFSDFERNHVFSNGKYNQFSDQGFKHIYGTENCNIAYWPGGQFIKLNDCRGDFYFQNRDASDKFSQPIISESNFDTIHFLGDQDTEFRGKNLDNLYNLSEIDLIDKCVDITETTLNLSNGVLENAGQNIKKDKKITIYYKRDFNPWIYQQKITKALMGSARDFEWVSGMRVNIINDDPESGTLKNLNSILAIPAGSWGNASQFLAKLPICVPNDGYRFDHWEDQEGIKIDGTYQFGYQEGREDETEVEIHPVFVPIEE